MDAKQQRKERVELKQTLGLFSACGLIFGTIVGGGIFVSPKGVVMEVGSVGLSLIIWAVCGIMALMGALSYAELGTMIPRSGGPYAYIQEAFGDMFGFLEMWAMTIIMVPTANAVMAMTFANYIVQPLFPDCESPHAAVVLVAALAIATSTFLNAFSVKWASWAQNTFTGIMMFSVLTVIVTGIVVMAQGSTVNFKNSFEGSVTAPGAIALAFYCGMFSFSGWDSVNFLVEELKNPYKNLPMAIIISVPTVAVMYIMANVAYFAVVSPEEILKSDAVAVTFAGKTFGSCAWIMPLLVACSTFGSLNGCIMCIGRVMYDGSRQGHLPDAISLINITRFTPMPAVAVLGVLSILMLFAGDVYTLITYSTFVEVLEFFMSVSALLYFRWKKPNMKRPIKVPMAIPVIFFLACFFLMAVTLITSPMETGMALLVIASGVPVYIIGVMWTKKPTLITSYLEAITLLIQKLTLSAQEDPN